MSRHENNIKYYDRSLSYIKRGVGHGLSRAPSPTIDLHPPAGKSGQNRAGWQNGVGLSILVGDLNPDDTLITGPVTLQLTRRLRARLFWTRPIMQAVLNYRYSRKLDDTSVP